MMKQSEMKFLGVLALVGIPATILPLPLPFTLYKWLLLFCLIGMLLNVLLRADYAMRSTVNIYPSHWSFVRRNWVTILIRIVPWGLGTFYVWTLHPEWATTVAKFFHVPDWLANWMTLPVNVITSLGLGFVIDVLLDKVQSWTAAATNNPYLAWLNTIFQGRLPVYDDEMVATDKLSTDRKVGE
jgi:hypothetical protein